MMNFSMKSKGFTLIEVLIAMILLSVALLALAGLMVYSTKNNSFGGVMTEAATFGQDKLEEFFITPWLNIVSGADQVMGSTGVNYSRNWTVVCQGAFPNHRLISVTIRVNWNDGTDHTVSLLSVLRRPEV
jgi:prepilin-type N-terminal cleavage/methylation domain-containing protein